MANEHRQHRQQELSSAIDGPPTGWSLYKAIIPIAGLIAFIVLMRALAGVGYVINPLEETTKRDYLITEDGFAPPIPDWP
jgi:hypothetical protein